MVSGKVTPEMVKKWQELRNSLGYRAIGRLYGVKHTTVQYWLVPGYREKHLFHDKEYRIAQKEKQLRIKNYRREYKNRPEVKLRYKEQRKIYDLKYKNIVRHIDNFFSQVFDDNPELDLEEITIRIDNLVGINLSGLTLENILNKYESKARDPPLIKAESGNYQLNPSFYENS